MAAKVGKKPDIYSRLTDPKLYTGAHKARFDSDGKGKGLAGRDMGNEGKINDLAQLTRGGGKGTKAAASSPTRKPVVSSKPHVFGSTKVPEPLTKKPAAQAAAPAAAAEAPAAAPAAASPTAAAGGAKRSKGDMGSRVTDTKLYTGAHKARFDSDGHGRGIAGRSDTQINDLSQLTRPGARKSVGGAASPSKAAGTVSGVAPIHVQKFGTQAAVARKIHVFQNGDKFHKGVVVTMVKSITTMAKLLNELTSKLALTTGAAKKVYRVVGAGESFTAVNSLDAFEDGGLYLVCGPEQIDKAKLPAALTSK